MQWVDDHEFRRDGKLYDVVRTRISGDTTYFTCINDTQEEKLFADLDNHVQREMGNSGQASKFDSFKDVFRDSLAESSVEIGTLAKEATTTVATRQQYVSFEPEVPPLPPRATPT